MEPVDLAVSSDLVGQIPYTEAEGSRSEDMAGRSEDSGGRSEDSEVNTGARILIPEDPVNDDRLRGIAAKVRGAKRGSADLMRSTVKKLCVGHFLTLNQIAQLLDRSTGDLRQRFIGPMIEDQVLERRYPRQPNHEQQAYRTRGLD